MAMTPIGPTSSPPTSGPELVQSVPAASITPGISQDTSADEAVTVDLFPTSPPADLMAQIAAASASYDQLAEQGLHVSFDGEDSGFSMTLHDQDGTELSSLRASDVLALAEGRIPNRQGASAPAAGPASAAAPAPEARSSDVDDQQYLKLDD